MLCTQVNTSDSGGGAEQISSSLLKLLPEFGVSTRLICGHKTTEDESVIQLPNYLYRNRWSQIANQREIENAQNSIRISPLQGLLFQPLRTAKNYLGFEDYDYPGTKHIESMWPNRTDIYHLHNLHGDYFDLRYLPQLSNQFPTVVTLHDGWMLSGHCAHGINCEKWKTGCGRCPHLDYYPAKTHDQTAYNWRKKRDIYRRSKLHVVAPSEWMMNQAKQSILAEAAESYTVIPNGVDLKVFSPQNKEQARLLFNIPQDVFIFGFAALGKSNPYKDVDTLLEAIKILSRIRPHVAALLIGDALDNHHSTLPSNLIVTDRIADRNRMALAYSACDVYVQCSRVETYPLAPMEAQACGVPVITSIAGGAVEAVSPDMRCHSFKPGHPEELASRLAHIHDTQLQLHKNGLSARQWAQQHSDKQMALEHSSLYKRITTER